MFEAKTINPLLTNEYKKAETLRKTKTDKTDAVQIAKMLRNGTGFRPVVSIPYDSDELKSLVRYRMSLVKNRSKEKISVKRLINILFPEYEKFFRDVHCPTSYAILFAYPGKHSLSVCRTPALVGVLRKASKGYYGEDLAVRLRECAKKSIEKTSNAKSYELRKTIKRIESLNNEISEIEEKMHGLLNKYNPPLATIPGVGTILAATIIGEVGDFAKFGSSNLRTALFLATQVVCQYIPEFSQYLAKKRLEEKHYFVAISHATKKLIRLMYALETQHRAYEPKQAH